MPLKRENGRHHDSPVPTDSVDSGYHVTPSDIDGSSVDRGWPQERHADLGVLDSTPAGGDL